MKQDDRLNDRMAVFNRRLKRLLLALIASYLPATILIGFWQGWGPAGFMVAWTGVSMGTFLTIALLFGVVKCPMERQKGKPRLPKKERRK